jgi:N-acylneuraminate cytidylyltransferase
MYNRLSLILVVILLMSCENANDKKIVFLGDSITFGWDTELFFPMADTYNMGVNGSRIDYITRLNRDFNEFTTVVIMMGTNDVNREKTSEPQITEHITNFITTYKEAIKKIHAEQIIVISVLPQYFTDSVKSRLFNNQINLMNQQLAQLPAIYPHVEYIDVNSSFKDKTGQLDMNYSTDGVHINVFGYRLLSEQLEAPLTPKGE